MTLASDAGEGARVGVPSKGRLRDEALELLGTAGYRVSALRGSGSIARLDGLHLIEMRPQDAAAALAAGALDAAFLATDIALEHRLDDLPAMPLGYARSTIVLASRDDDGRTAPEDLAGAVIATHMPVLTRSYLSERGIDARVVPMGGSLEGVCAAGLADAIVDNRETGTSLAQNRLRVLDEIVESEAEFVHRPAGGPVGALLADLDLRLEAAVTARRHRYVMLHVPAGSVEELTALFHGLEAPTVLPLAGRRDLVAVHFVVRAGELWAKLGDLRALGASGIVALEPVALLE